MRLTFTLIFCNIGLAALLFEVGGCTVYAPMQPTMPLVTTVRQTEATASLQPNGRAEVTAAYSPAPHLVLTAGGSVCPKLGTNNFLVSRQFEVGIGSYLLLGPHWLLNGLGGYGQAVNNRGYRDLGIIFSSTYSEYNARYNKLFAQVGLAHVSAGSSMGFTYRLTQVHFSTLTDTELGDLPLPQMLRHEGLFFVRRPLGSTGTWQTQVALGLSVSSTPKRNDDLGYPIYGQAEYHANRNLLPAFYASLGLVYHPRWGRQ